MNTNTQTKKRQDAWKTRVVSFSFIFLPVSNSPSFPFSLQVTLDLIRQLIHTHSGITRHTDSYQPRKKVSIHTMQQHMYNVCCVKHLYLCSCISCQRSPARGGTMCYLLLYSFHFWRKFLQGISCGSVMGC